MIAGTAVRARLASARSLFAVSRTYLRFVLPRVNWEIARWQARAVAIPDARLRAAALEGLSKKRFQVDGAGLLAALAPGRNHRLVRLLVAYQVLCDYLDTITEWPVPGQVESGRRLHRALAEALDTGATVSDHYARHPHKDDGGYVRALVGTCRSMCASLPSYARVRPQVVAAAARVAVQALNHDGDPARRTGALERWARDELPAETEARWFEVTAAAAHSLHIHMLLALAADSRTTERDIAEAARAYFPWACAAATMLDSLVDRDEDAAHGNHSYVSYYESDGELTERLTLLIERAASGVRQLRRGELHAVIVAGMAAMYLSDAAARTPAVRDTRRAALAAAGDPAKLILPIMVAWRALRSFRARWPVRK